MVQEIIEIANQGPAEDSHAYGSADGEAWLSTMYHEALKDALMRWHRLDLKQHFSQSNPKH